LQIPIQDQSEEIREFRQGVEIASRSVGELLPKAEKLKDAMLEAGDATRSLRKANTRLAATIGDFAEAAKMVAEWGDLEGT
jgi:hypothetical protein